VLNRIISYINNLHPDGHTALYDVIEDVIAASIPMWDITLAPLVDQGFLHFQRIKYTGLGSDPDPCHMDREDGPPDDGGASGELRQEWLKHIRRTVLPEPEVFSPDELKSPKPFSLKSTFGRLGRPLQVIVKLANIELTPEKPKYNGGSWHVEGKLVCVDPV
jgi:Protein of unknown function (DUF4246)